VIKKLSLMAGLLFCTLGHAQAKALHKLHNWHNVRTVLNESVIVEMRMFPQLVHADIQLSRYGSIIVLEGEILEAGNAGVILKIKKVSGKPVSSDASMLGILLGSRVKMVMGKEKEVMYAVAPILKTDVVRVMKRNSNLRRWCTLGMAPKEKTVYCPLPQSEAMRTAPDAGSHGNSEEIYITVE